MSELAAKESHEWNLEWRTTDTLVAEKWLDELPSLETQQDLVREADSQVAATHGSGFESIEYTIDDDYGLGSRFSRVYRHAEQRSDDSLHLHFENTWTVTAFCTFDRPPTDKDKERLARESIQRVCDIYPGVHWTIDSADLDVDPFTERDFFLAKLSPVDIEDAKREYPRSGEQSD